MSKPLPWFFNAARRTVVSAFPGLARPADQWATERLERAEAQLFLQLPRQERAHGIEVAQRLLERWPAAPPTWVRAALLHDVGKLGTPQFVLWRVLTHLLPAASVAAEPRLPGLAGARQARVHHAEYGATLISRAGGSEEVARLVRWHHDPAADIAVDQGSDFVTGLEALKAADERT